MRVALLTPSYQIDGGIAVHVRRSAVALTRAGHQAIIVAGDEVPQADGITVAGLGHGVAQNKIGMALIRTLKGQVDILHFHGLDDPALVAAANTTFATVVSSHGWAGCPAGARFFGKGRECPRTFGPLCVPNMLVRNCKHQRDPRVVAPMYRNAYRQLATLSAADVPVAHSDAVRRHLVANGISGACFIPLPIDAPEAGTRLPDGHPRIAYAGRLTLNKGVEVLLASAPWFDADIDICGDGDRRYALERMADRLGLGRRVTFHGWCDSGRLEHVYDSAWLTVVPSLWPEPFGMTGPEAMARGRAVVATATGGTSDWLHNRVNGIAVSPGDPVALGEAVRELLGDRQRLRQMGEAARAVVLDKFTESTHVDSLLRAYDTALKCLSRRAPCTPSRLRAKSRSATA